METESLETEETEDREDRVPIASEETAVAVEIPSTPLEVTEVLAATTSVTEALLWEETAVAVETDALEVTEEMGRPLDL